VRHHQHARQVLNSLSCGKKRYKIQNSQGLSTVRQSKNPTHIKVRPSALACSEDELSTNRVIAAAELEISFASK
jgi:hypothetical protein